MFGINENIILVCREAFSRFVGIGSVVGLFFMAIIYIIFIKKTSDFKDNRIKIVLGIYSIIVLLLNLCPIFTKILTDVLRETDTYWRVYWLLPVGIVVAFVFTDIIFNKDKKNDKVFASVLMIIIIVLSGKFMYSNDDGEKFVKVNNYYKVPDNVLDIIEFVSKDDNDYKRITGPEPFIIYSRQIDGKVLLGEERNVSGQYGEWSMITLINEKNVDEICNYCERNKCNYLVLNKDFTLPKEYTIAYNMKKMYENDEFVLYRLMNITE